MKRKLLTILSSFIILLNLFATPAFAGTWIQHQGNEGWINGIYLGGWEYQNDDGSNVIGWKYINNNWYYFNNGDGCAYTGVHTINGKDYYFDPFNCDMKHDQYVKIGQGRMGMYYWANSDGSIDYNKNWCPV